MGDNFKKQILEWEKTQQAIKSLNDQLKPYQKRLQLYKEKSAGLEGKIVDYMRENKMGGSRIELGDVSIVMGESKRTETVSRQYMERKCGEFLGDEKMAKRLVNYVYDSRERNVSNCLRRKENKRRELKK